MKLKAFFSALIIALLAIGSHAQNYNLNSNPPLDPNIKQGVLKNGMTYYIRSNKLPEDRAEFYIVHNVGAILEEDSQNGLAHFAEHMAFNGTKNFPNKELLNYLETIGCKFGRNVNAFTSTDVTCYNVSSVPITREGIVDTCLLILHDWSSYISFEPEEIDSERGVIMEEWRTRGGAWSRIRDKQRPIMFKDSKYATRNVIGDTSIIQNFTDSDIKDYYHKWYRPDLQAVIVVGDFDLDSMEQKVIDRFSQIPPHEQPTPKPFYDIPDNEEPLIAIATDPEATNTSITIYTKHNRVEPENKNLSYLRNNIRKQLINQMLNARIAELLQKNDAPCTRAYSYYSSFTSAKDAFIATANAKTNQTIQSMELLLTESMRMKQHGFLQSELNRAKANFIRSTESAFLDKDKQKHNKYVWEYFGHYTSNEAATGITYYKDFTNEMIPTITLQEINELAASFISKNNMVITIAAPQKEDIRIPTEKELLTTLSMITNQLTEPYTETLESTQLIDKLPKAGTIKTETTNEQLGTTEWKLSNGMKVVIKTTDFKEDEFSIKGISKGGCFQVPDEDYLAAQNISRFVGQMGLGKFSKTDLSKVLSGKRAYTSIGVGDDNEQINGGGSPQDIELVLQMIHLRFTSPRFDEEVYQTVLGKYKNDIENRALSPRSTFGDSIRVTMLNHHPLRKPVTIERLDEITYDKIKKYYADRFITPDQFTWMIVGNVDKKKLKPLIEKYIASLPSGNRNEKYVDRGIRLANGTIKNHFTRDMETAKTSVFAFYKGDMPYELQNFIYLSAIKHILDIRYVETIREEEGGTYGVGVGRGYDKHPIEQGYIQLSFDTDPEKTEKMVAILHDEFNSLINKEPAAENVQKAKEYFIKSHAENVKENSYWMHQLNRFYFMAINTHSNFESLVNDLTPKSIHEFAKKTFSPNEMVEVIMQPTEK